MCHSNPRPSLGQDRWLSNGRDGRVSKGDMEEGESNRDIVTNSVGSIVYVFFVVILYNKETRPYTQHYEKQAFLNPVNLGGSGSGFIGFIPLQATHHGLNLGFP